MYAIPKPARTFALFLLFTACGGSSAKKNTVDAKALTPDVGKVLDAPRADSKVTVPDTALAKDVRDATKVSDAVDGSKADAVRDSQGDTSRDAGVADARDSAEAKLDAVVLDGAKLDGAKLDAKTDTAGTTKDAPADAVSMGDVGPNSCSNPIVVPWSSTSQYAEITVDTTDEAQDFTFSCGTGGSDLVLQFRLQASNSIVYADTFGTPWNTILQFSDVCPPVASTSTATGVLRCNDDACGTTQSQATAIMTAGYHYLIVSGVNGESGPVTIHFQRAEVSMDGLVDLPAGTATIQGQTSGASSSSACQGAGPEISYGWISCPEYNGGALSASTCDGSTMDIVMSLQVPRTDYAVCANGDACGRQELLAGTIPPGAGINLLTVDGDSPRDQGDFSLTYTRP